MNWLKGMLGLETDGIERKAIEYPTISINNQDNFQRNLVTVPEARLYDTGSLVADNRNIGSAIGLSAVYACVNLLAGTISSLPLMVYATDINGVRSVARRHPLYYVLHDSPNFDQTTVDFWEFMCVAIELQGNAYAEIASRSDGGIYSLTPLRPDLVSVRRNSAGDLEYRTNENGNIRLLDQKSVLHIRGFGGSPLGGASTLSVCRATFDSALSTNRAASATFANGINTTGVVSSERDLTPDQMKIAAEAIDSKYAGARNAGRPLVLNNGMKWQQISMSPEDAQMLETRRFGIEEICRVFGVPPHMVGHTSNSTSWGTGLEQQTLGFQKFTLRKRLKRIEQALEKQLLTSADRAAGITIEFNIEGLLRGDSAGRSAFYQSALMNGYMTINEVRALENWAPLPGGDVPRMQSQNIPITEAGKPPVAA